MSTAEDIGNQHGYLCPECNEGDQLEIEATRSVTAKLLPDGIDDDGGDTEWDDDSSVTCNGCEWTGKVKDLKIDPDFED